MYRIPVNEIKEKILNSGKLKGEELDAKIKKKINELSGLISEEGAAHIIANELGIELIPASSEQAKLKIKEIYAGMRNITTVGKVVRKFEVREFQKGETSGKVCSLIMGDETATIRVVFWNDQVDKLKNVNENDILLVKEAYVKENNNNKEIHLGEKGEVIINPENEIIKNVRQSSAFERKKIQDLVDGNENVEIFGTVIQIFDPHFFNLCSQCGKKVNESEGNFICNEHGSVAPAVSYVLNLILDDGTGNIRGIFWKNQVNHLLAKEEKDVLVYREELARFEGVKNDLLGEQFKLMGRVKRNEMFDRLEFNVQLVEKANPQDEIVRLEKIKE